MRILTGDEILACARGFYQPRRSPEGLQFLRFSDKAMAFYHTQDNWRIRAGCPAGVRLEFVTDSPAVRVEAAIPTLPDWCVAEPPVVRVKLALPRR